MCVRERNKCTGEESGDGKGESEEEEDRLVLFSLKVRVKESGMERRCEMRGEEGDVLLFLQGVLDWLRSLASKPDVTSCLQWHAGTPTLSVLVHRGWHCCL